MTASTITTIPEVPVTASAAPWAITDEDVFGTHAAILRHDFTSRVDGDGITWNRRVEYLLPRRDQPVDFDGHEALVNVDPAAVVRWSTFEDHVKADVVFTSKPAILELWFAVNFVGVTAFEDEGGIFLVDPITGEHVGNLPRPFLLDGDRDRYELAWVLGDGCLTVVLPDLEHDLWAGAVFDPTTVDTSTAVSPTSQSNQKHVLRTSTGVLVMVFGATTTNAELWYSTDEGATWTQYSGSDISGWLNGSIFAYVDSGGTERVVAVWKQTGTSGGTRTDGYVYVMVGSFNAGRTTLTWPVSATLVSNEAATVNYPDLVAFAESAGGQAWLVTSHAQAPNGYGGRWPVTIDSSGVPTVGTGVIIGTANGASGVHVFPSISYDPLTKRLFVTWSNGATGAGKGVRFTTASYSAGVWTWALTEVEALNTIYAASAVNGAVICRWDAGRSAVVIAAFRDNGSNIDIAVLDSTNFTSFTARISTTVSFAAGVYGLSMAIDPSTGDVYLIGSQFSAGTYNNVGYYKATRSGATLTLGALVVTDTFTGSGSVPPFTSACSSAARISWVYSSGSSTPFSIKYDSKSLNTAPNAPTWTTTAGAKDINSSLPLAWTNNDPDIGDTMSAWAIKRDIAGTVRWWNGTSYAATVETFNTGTTPLLTLASGWGADADANHSYYVTMKDAAGVAATGYSAALVITPSAKVQPTLDTPTAGATIGTSTLNAAWTVAQQTEYRLKLYDAAGTTTLWDSGWIVDSVARVRTIAYTLANGTNYKVGLTTKNTEGLAGDEVIHSIAVSYTPPATATLALNAVDDPGHITITITNPAPSGSQPAVAHNELYRRTVGDTDAGVRVADTVANNGNYTDELVGNLEDLEYRALTVGANGTTSFSAWRS